MLAADTITQFGALGTWLCHAVPKEIDLGSSDDPCASAAWLTSAGYHLPPLTFWRVGISILMYETLDWMMSCVLARFPFRRLPSYSANHVVGMINAFICSVSSICALPALMHAPEVMQVAIVPDEDAEVVQAACIIVVAIEIFNGWVLYDLYHVLREWPALGKADIVIHHVGTVMMSAMLRGYRVMIFPTAWLLLMEISSFFFNARLLLRSVGASGTQAMTVVTVLFALSFFIVRVVFVWIGIGHLLTRLRPLLLSPSLAVPHLVVDVACGGILLLGILNATWMRAIVKHAVKEYRSARPSEASTTPISSQKKSSPRLTTSANACL